MIPYGTIASIGVIRKPSPKSYPSLKDLDVWYLDPNTLKQHLEILL